MCASTYPVMDDGRPSGTVTIFIDRTEAVNSGRQIAMMSAIAELQRTATSPEDLLQRACDTLVELGKVQLAWIGSASRTHPGDVDIVCASGLVDYLVPGFVSEREDEARGQGPAGIVLRTGVAQVVDDLANTSLFEEWRDRAAAFHLASTLAIPLTISGVRSVLSVYADAAFTFDADLTSRFTEVAKALESGMRRLEAVAEIQANLKALEEAQSLLRESEERFRLSFEGNLAPMTLRDANDRVVEVNDAFCRLIGRSREELITGQALDYIHPEDVHLTLENFASLRSGDVDRINYIKRYIHRDGRVVIVDVSKQAVRDASGALRYVILSARDITGERALTERLTYQATHDSLTGLANRMLIMDRLSHAIARTGRDGSMVGVILLDLDDFKEINDTLGHVVGDVVLKDIAQRLSEVTRESDTLGRLGGDEFIYLAEDQEDEEEVVALAQRLREVVERPLALSVDDITLGVSVGVLVDRDRQLMASECLQRVDLAMYDAKRRGGGRVSLFSPTMQRRADSRYRLSSELRRACGERQLVMNYQPIIELHTGHIVGFEALMRWPHPTRGEIPPSEFIPLAEESNLILELGNFAMTSAVAVASKWSTRGSRDAPYVSVNISAAQFKDQQLFSQIDDALDVAGFDGRRLVLEVTESVFLHDTTEAMRVIGMLRERGIRVALDDFGTGYSSLSYLARLAPDIIKIDKAFVIPDGNDSRSSLLLRAITALGNDLGIPMVIEGIQTVAQLQMALSSRVAFGQGYLFSPAVDERMASRMASGPGFALGEGLGSLEMPDSGDGECC